MNNKGRIINSIFNALIVALTIVSVFLILFGEDAALLSPRWSAIKFFTVQSNLFVGITSLISLFFLFKKDKVYPLWLTILKMTATVSVGITFTTVMVYLGPVYSYAMMLKGANLFMHLIIPVLALVSFAIFESKIKYKFAFNFISVAPVLLYGIFYLINVAVNNDYGNVKGADWYAFGTYGLGIGFLCLFVLMLLGFGMSVGIYFLNQKVKIKAIHE